MPRLRRGIALFAVVLSTGGLLLHRVSAAGPHGTSIGAKVAPTLVPGKNSASFSGSGGRGMVSLSHRALGGGESRIYADVRLVGEVSDCASCSARAPTSLAVVLDTSGSMSGEKIEDARRSVLRLIEQMRDDDEIALVRYSDASELIQPLARVGDVRRSLSERVRALEASGGTNIPSGLAHGLRALDGATRMRVKRVVLVSDGLDGTRAQAESLARSGFLSGVTVSSLGIGVDFDEGYMGSLAKNGHGNFAFVNDGGSLTAFLGKELAETASTRIEGAKVQLELPPGMRFVSATGADAEVSGNGRSVALAVGALFAGDERRVVVEMAAEPTIGASTYELQTAASWSEVGGAFVRASAPPLAILTGRSAAEVEAGRDGAVLASAVSVLASRRQVEAASAYSAGDVDRAARIVVDNEKALADAIAAAPADVRPGLAAQKDAYGQQRRDFSGVSPRSAEGRAAAKAAAAKEMSNFDRKAW